VVQGKGRGVNREAFHIIIFYLDLLNHEPCRESASASSVKRDFVTIFGQHRPDTTDVNDVRVTGIRGLMRGMATLPQGNQELLVVRDKVGRSPGELGVSKFMECDIFPFSALTLLVG